MNDLEKGKILSLYEEFGTAKEYFKNFEDKDIEKLIEKILDIRKFEIELYWKRATYHWAFIAAIIAGYFVVSSNTSSLSPTDELVKLQYLLNCLGIVFSVAWYFVNRGSKYWQNNWESHLDIMEDKVLGPLYKTNASKSRDRFFDLLGAYPFSPTKINHLLSLFVIFIWITLLVEFIVHQSSFRSFDENTIFYYIVLMITLSFLFAMFFLGKAGNKKKNDGYTVIDFEKRGVKNS